ncbi:hypothetical protein HDU92_007088 [Lobulomyces angularis]|nr:hypothetical protein HDU92_007088 [Lobulomyces angularis]
MTVTSTEGFNNKYKFITDLIFKIQKNQGKMSVEIETLALKFLREIEKKIEAIEETKKNLDVEESDLLEKYNVIKRELNSIK